MDTAKHLNTSPAVLAMDSTLEDSHQTTRRPPDDKGGTSAETFLKDSFTPTASHSQFACSAKRRNSVTKASRLQRTIEVTHESTSEGSSKIEHSEGDNDADSAEATVPIKQSSENIDIDLNATMEKLSQVSLEITKDDRKRKKGEKYTRRAVMYLFDQGLSMEQDQTSVSLSQATRNVTHNTPEQQRPIHETRTKNTTSREATAEAEDGEQSPSEDQPLPTKLEKKASQPDKSALFNQIGCKTKVDKSAQVVEERTEQMPRTASTPSSSDLTLIPKQLLSLLAPQEMLSLEKSGKKTQEQIRELQPYLMFQEEPKETTINTLASDEEISTTIGIRAKLRNKVHGEKGFTLALEPQKLCMKTSSITKRETQAAKAAEKAASVVMSSRALKPSSFTDTHAQEESTVEEGKTRTERGRATSSEE
ncbi:hypothetical protein AXG93_4311s1010 [Marchantia polymorpha subsp. ruderalis]|uniref:Uncharacterized protein n=1 Tax=Marchantia polymorpha subsp. ruderalis TaxID=1480154 RepID=A0A176W3U8_MARPO|nr:hypothetical protein AXG93_4311s1010 [Marchantia polymorpha subsp. ruderalis]